jgi:hypothetical protein
MKKNREWSSKLQSSVAYKRTAFYTVWLSANTNTQDAVLCKESCRRKHADYYGLSLPSVFLLQQSTLSSSHVGSLRTSGSDRTTPCHSPSSIPRVAMVIASPQVLYIRVKTLLALAGPRMKPWGKTPYVVPHVRPCFEIMKDDDILHTYW